MALPPPSALAHLGLRGPSVEVAGHGFPDPMQQLVSSADRHTTMLIVYDDGTSASWSWGRHERTIVRRTAATGIHVSCGVALKVFSSLLASIAWIRPCRWVVTENAGLTSVVIW